MAQLLNVCNKPTQHFKMYQTLRYHSHINYFADLAHDIT